MFLVFHRTRLSCFSRYTQMHVVLRACSDVHLRAFHKFRMISMLCCDRPQELGLNNPTWLYLLVACTWLLGGTSRTLSRTESYLASCRT